MALISRLMKIEKGITSIIGAGGKTTLMETLAEEMKTCGTVLLCTTTKIFRPSEIPVVTDDNADSIKRMLQLNPVICVGKQYGDEKLTAPEIPIRKLAEFADYVFVEADGARRLPLKAHAPQEPVIPGESRLTILVTGADCFGQEIGRVCHRPELFTQRLSVQEKEFLSPALLARHLCMEGLGNLIFFNQAETEPVRKLCRQTAKEIRQLTGTDKTILCGSLHKRKYEIL